MSVNRLADTGQYEVNAKRPSSYDSIANDYFIMKPGIKFNNELQGDFIGFVAKGLDMRNTGAVSDNVESYLSEPLSFFQVRDDDEVHMNFNDTQIGGYTDIDVNFGGHVFTLTWDAPSTSFQATLVGSFDYMSTKVGGSYKVTVVDVT